jgi:hypothetical protein
MLLRESQLALHAMSEATVAFSPAWDPVSWQCQGLRASAKYQDNMMYWPGSTTVQENAIMF